MKKIYQTPTTDVIIMKASQQLLAGSELMGIDNPDVSPGGAHSRGLDDFDFSEYGI